MADGQLLEPNGFARAAPFVRLRLAVASDVETIAEFQTVCWREAYRGLVPQSYLDRVTVEDREARWRERLITGARQIALAESESTVVGVVSWGLSSDPLYTPALELMSLYVAASHRGAGVAARLMDLAIGSAPAHLWVFEDNRRALSFYAKHGFNAVGHRKIDPDTGVWETRLVRD
jgi:GNAT superfamily N-acetyltransferase